jgi:hypothetical protein
VRRVRRRTRGDMTGTSRGCMLPLLLLLLLGFPQTAVSLAVSHLDLESPNT